ncbi:hypothetical protein [Allocoleopsis sp.]|uniref:hypothetical protein n=1 Tax=Allocoleopsis sp. TaxID=3088169 RepID=UPI002FD10AF5
MKISDQLVSAFASTQLARMAFGVGISTLAIAIASTILPQTASAQTAPGVTPGSVQPFPDSSRQNERDTFGGNLGGGDLSIFNLIHRAQLGNGSFDEQEQTRTLNNAAEEFKRKQRALIGNPQPQLPENPSTNVQPESPQGN